MIDPGRVRASASKLPPAATCAGRALAPVDAHSPSERPRFGKLGAVTSEPKDIERKDTGSPVVPLLQKPSEDVLLALTNPRSIAWSQYTFSAGCAAEWDHVADLNVFPVDHNTFDQQLDECTPLVEVSVLEAVTDRRSEVLDARGQALHMVVLYGVCFECLLFAENLGESGFKLTAACLEFLKGEHLRLVRID